jgi:hypothetical protein
VDDVALAFGLHGDAGQPAESSPGAADEWKSLELIMAELVRLRLTDARPGAGASTTANAGNRAFPSS